MQGELADARKLDADINAPALGGLVPGLAGTVKGSSSPWQYGKTTDPRRPAVHSLKWQNDLSVADAKSKGDITSAEQIKRPAGCDGESAEAGRSGDQQPDPECQRYRSTAPAETDHERRASLGTTDAERRI